MHPILNIAVRATRQAGSLIIQAYEQQRERIEVNQKAPHNGADTTGRLTERAMVEVIHKAYPHHTIVSAVNGLLTDTNSEVRWIIEPLAGTTNFIKRLPHFAVAIAVVIKGHTEIAVLYDVLRNELFTAVRGGGAQMNGYRLRSGSGANDLSGSVLATGSGFKAESLSMKILQVLLQQGADFRRSGCVALDLAYVAAGRVDGFFEQALQPWEFAAGELLVREAGGLVTDFGGSPDQSITGDLVAGPAKVVKALLAIVRRVQGAAER